MSGRAATISIIPGKYALSVGRADMPTPKGWRWLALEDVARLESGHTPSRLHPEYWDGGIAWIGIKDARTHHGGVISETFQTVTQAGIDNSAARLLPAKTVCLSRTASVGYVVVMARAMATSQDFVNWVCGPSLDPHFLKQLLIAENESLFRFGKGSTHTTIYYPEVKAFHICLPPLNEQRRIVAKLESLQARSRRAREALDAVPPLLEKLRQSILAAAFRGDLTKDWRAKHRDVEPASELLKRIRVERRKKWEEAELAKLKAKGKAPRDDGWKGKYKEPEPVDEAGLPELPEGWCWASLDDLAWDAGYGTSAKCDYDGKGVAVLRIPNISRGTMDFSDVKRALEPEVGFGMLVLPGDMLIVRTNGSRDLIGRAAVAVDSLPEPMSFASYLIRFRLVGGGSVPGWVARYWQSPAIRSVIEGHAASSAGQYNVSLGELASCPIPLAPEAEQAAVLDALAVGLDARTGVENTVGQASKRLGELDRSLLAKAFRGELVPQDPTDEPAADMLARLRAAEAATPPKPTKSRR